MFEELIIRTANALIESQIPYMIIGGQAVLLYGEPRLTNDIDITLGVGDEKLAQIIDLIGKIGLTPIPKGLETFVKETYVLPTQCVASGIRVDFIFSYTPYERQAIERSNKIKIKGREINFASVEDIVIHKIFAGRARDIEDVKAVILKNPNLDIVYVKKWLMVFGNGFWKCFNRVMKEIRKLDE